MGRWLEKGHLEPGKAVKSPFPPLLFSFWWRDAYISPIRLEI